MSVTDDSRAVWSLFLFRYSPKAQSEKGVRLRSGGVDFALHP